MRAGIAAAVAAGVTALAGCVTPPPPAPPPPAKVSLDGYITVKPGYSPPVFGAEFDPCVIQSSYPDVAQGAQITVTDETGAVIALGQLEEGKIAETRKWLEGKTVATVCNFPFSPMTVPDRPFYGVEVARRGVVRYSRAQLDQSLHMTLG